ncbi:hypothetical protein BDV23DRAFT_96583 [Aspergillus alliaceus]|uniref:Transferase family-domain-containing protein n=1 Tax=Petromyces alliaceus TaxID=209559 RepID=A0A5N7CPN6_PETAA|nr:hypothetical protein BDV23DRAFT_96583 [Aspergillus alliaceus]
MGLFMKKNGPRPEKVPTDTVVPVSFTDDQPHARALCIHLTSRFDDVLDTEALRRALNRLFQIKGWRKLGARLRLNDGGKLEYHIPAHYDEKRPGFDYTVAQHALGINDHHLGAQFPKATVQPALVGCPEDIAPVCLGPDCPKQIEDWLYSDRPQLAIHVASFDNATLLTITFLHTLTDAMGIATFLKAWTAVLDGREVDVPIFQGIDEAPMEQLSERTPAEQYINYNLMLKPLGLIIFAFWYILDLLWNWREEFRLLCIPGHIIDELRTQALHELNEQNSQDPPTFLSESDSLLAWWTRALVKGINPSPDRPITLMNVMDIRATALDDPTSLKTALVANAVIPSTTFLRAHQILHKPLSFVASHIRRSLVQLRTKPQIEAFLCASRAHAAKTGHPPLFSESSALLIACTNWHRGRFFEADFSAAVVKTGVPLEERVNGLGRPSFVIPNGHTNGISMRNGGSIIGKDAEGNWWLAWTLKRQAWLVIDEELRVLGGKKGQ